MSLLDSHVQARVFEEPAAIDPILELPGMSFDMRVFIRLQDQYFKEYAGPFDFVQPLLCRPRHELRLPDFPGLSAEFIHPFEAIHARTLLAQWFLGEIDAAELMLRYSGQRCAILHPIMSYAYIFVDAQLYRTATGVMPATTLFAFEAIGLGGLDFGTRGAWTTGMVSGPMCFLAADLVRIAVDAIYFKRQRQRAGFA